MANVGTCLEQAGRGAQDTPLRVTVFSRHFFACSSYVFCFMKIQKLGKSTHANNDDIKTRSTRSKGLNTKRTGNPGQGGAEG